MKISTTSLRWTAPAFLAACALSACGTTGKQPEASTKEAAPPSGGMYQEQPQTPPDDDVVFGSTAFDAVPGGAVFSVLVYDEERPEHTGRATVRVWEGFTDNASNIPTSPPSSEARVSTINFDLRQAGPWSSNDVHVTDGQQGEDIFWVYVSVEYQRHGWAGPPPTDTFNYVHDWNRTQGGSQNDPFTRQ